jgi:hypothetical protein
VISLLFGVCNEWLCGKNCELSVDGLLLCE